MQNVCGKSEASVCFVVRFWPSDLEMKFRAVENAKIAFENLFKIIYVLACFHIRNDLVGAEENSIRVFCDELSEFVRIFAEAAKAGGRVFDVAEAGVGIKVRIFVHEG